jgi:hypothetical protein
MRSTSNQSLDQAAPHRLMEPDLAAWAEKMAIESASDRRGLWYGALAFWIVVTCIIVARILLLDPNRIHPAAAASATHSMQTGAPSAQDAKL